MNETSPFTKVDFRINIKGAQELSITSTSEPEVRAKDNELQFVLNKITDFVKRAGIDLGPLARVNSSVATAVKNNLHVAGFKTVVYGLGGPDVLGAAEFLSSTGGNIVSISNEDILNTRAAIALLNDPNWEIIAKDTLEYYTDLGYYYIFQKGLELIPGNGTFGLAINLAAAGVSPQDVKLTDVQTVQYKDQQTGIETVQIKRGEQAITQFFVYPVTFTTARMEGGDNTQDGQLQVLSALLENFDGNQPTVALSKASQYMGISYIVRLLKPGTTLVYDNSVEEGDIAKRLVAISQPKTLGESVSLLPEYDQNFVHAPSWGYLNPRYVRYATVLGLVANNPGE